MDFDRFVSAVNKHIYEAGPLSQRARLQRAFVKPVQNLTDTAILVSFKTYKEMVLISDHVNEISKDRGNTAMLIFSVKGKGDHKMFNVFLKVLRLCQQPAGKSRKGNQR
jgi:hypothetical protein